MPLAWHYRLSDWLLFPLVYHVARYRRKIAHVDTVLGECLDEARRLMCGPVFCELNADKGFLVKEIEARGGSARGYREFENKHLKISNYLRKWWRNVRFLEGTDKAYVAQIMSYCQGRGHDDAADSAGCVCRFYDRRN